MMHDIVLRAINERIEELYRKITFSKDEVRFLEIERDTYLEIIDIINKKKEAVDTWAARKEEIYQKIDSGEYRSDGRHQRKPGTRPESLKNIRKALAERDSNS